MLCECCEKEEGVIDCKECSRVADQWRVLCVECSAFIHRGAYKNHQLISPELKKKRDAVKEKILEYKAEREWEQTMITNIAGVRKELEERQAMYEDDVKRRVTELQQRLKQQGIAMIARIRELSAAKLEFLDNLSKQVLENVKSGNDFETKINSLIANISEFEREMGSDESSAEYENKLRYKFVEWDRAGFPHLSLPIRIDYTKVEEATEQLKLEMVENEDNEEETQEDKEAESKPSDVTLQSRIDNQGVFWIHVDFETKKNNIMEKLFDISYNIRTKYLLDREWKAYNKLDQKPSIGEIVYALWTMDDKWYRARVEDTNETQATVVFCDFGNSEKIEYSQILPVQDHSVSDLPFQALESSLFPEPKEIPLNVKFEFTDMIAGGPLHCKVLGKRMFGAKEITHIELVKDMPDGSQLNLRQYLETRCQTKKKSDMPFSSRDIRLLENPNAFDKSKSSPAKQEESTDDQQKNNTKDETPSEVKAPVDAEATVNGEVTVNGTSETKDAEENVTNGTSEGKPAEEAKDDIIVECQEVEEIFDLPIPSVYAGETLQLHYDHKNHPLGRDGTFWAMLHRTEHQNAEWERFKEALNKDGEKADHCTKITEGSVVLAYWRKSWHRAKIDSFDVNDQADGRPKVKVRLTDQGTSCKVPENQLRVMPMKYFRVQPQGIKCNIANKKISQFPRDSQTHFIKLVEGKPITALIKSVSNCTSKETCLEVSLQDFSEGKTRDVADMLYEREQNRQKRHQMSDGDVPPPGPGVIHLKKAEENWQDDFMMSGEHGTPQGVVPLMQAGVEDGLVYDPHHHPYPQGSPAVASAHHGQHPHQQQADQYMAQHEHYPGSYPVEQQYHMTSPQQQQQDMYGQQARPSQDGRNDGNYRQNDRRNYGRNDNRGGQGGWRGGGDGGGRTCFKCGDPSHYSKNCPKQGGQQRRSRRT